MSMSSETKDKIKIIRNAGLGIQLKLESGLKELSKIRTVENHSEACFIAGVAYAEIWASTEALKDLIIGGLTDIYNTTEVNDEAEK